MNLEKYITNIPDFPEKGINFKDISPLLANGEALNYSVMKMVESCRDADIILGPDARGFLFGTPVAAILSKPFVMVRKQKKLPGEVIQKEYLLEYGEKNILEIQTNRIQPGQKVIIIDDVLATGGTTKAIIDLVESQGGIVSKIVFLLELTELHGANKFKDIEVVSLIKT
jgi:adenine phosphoribosyltransferase